jgi:hypothetical protein
VYRVELRTRGTSGTRGDLRQRRYISSVDKVTMAGVESLRQRVRHRTGVCASKNQECKKKSETFAFDYRAIDCFSRSLHFTASFNDQEARKFQFHLCKWLLWRSSEAHLLSLVCSLWFIVSFKLRFRRFQSSGIV